MKRPCRKGNYIVEEGDWVEVYEEGTNKLLASFKITYDMCTPAFERQLRLRFGIEFPVQYKLKIK